MTVQPHILRDSIQIAAPLERVFLLSTHIDTVRKTLGLTPVSGRTTGHVVLGDRVVWRGWKFLLPQVHHTLITGYSFPSFFQDTQERGRFASFQHDHHFAETSGTTILHDEVRFTLPFGSLGRLVAHAVLIPHIRSLLSARFQLLKRLAESEQWREILTSDLGPGGNIYIRSCAGLINSLNVSRQRAAREPTLRSYMPTLLKIDVSPRGEHSVSRKLGAWFETAWKTAHADGSVVTRDLAHTDLPFVTLPWIMGAYSDPGGHTPEQKQALRVGDDLIAELESADQYLLTTPMYNFAVPAILKAWIDHVARAGKTFKVNPDGSYTGLLTGKKLTILIASAGAYAAPSPAEAYNFERPYLRHMFAFLGVTEVTFIEAGGTYVLNHGGKTVDEFAAPLHDQIVAAASAS